MTSAQHSAVTCEHGTPPVASDLARHVLGGIDLDPFSSDYWNHYTVKAQRFCDRTRNGMVQPWQGKVFINAPGGDKATKLPSLVRPAWERLVEFWMNGEVDSACWLSYSLEQLVMLQGSPAHPLQFPTLVFCERLDYLRRPPGGGSPQKGGAPTHGSAMTLLPSRRFASNAHAQVARFRDRGSSLGALTRSFAP